MKLILIVISLLFSAFAYGNSDPQHRYEINYGILKLGSTGLYYVETTTTDIPYITESQNREFKFGYTVKASAEGFLLHTRITLPIAKHTYVNRSYEMVSHSDTKTKTITTENRYYLNESHELVMSLEDGDPPGAYVMEIFINDLLYKSVTFNVGGR